MPQTDEPNTAMSPHLRLLLLSVLRDIYPPRFWQHDMSGAPDAAVAWQAQCALDDYCAGGYTEIEAWRAAAVPVREAA